jgi:hypothetical protein
LFTELQFEDTHLPLTQSPTHWPVTQAQPSGLPKVTLQATGWVVHFPLIHKFLQSPGRQAQPSGLPPIELQLAGTHLPATQSLLLPHWPMIQPQPSGLLSKAPQFGIAVGAGQLQIPFKSHFPPHTERQSAGTQV